MLNEVVALADARRIPLDAAAAQACFAKVSGATPFNQAQVSLLHMMEAGCRASG